MPTEKCTVQDSSTVTGLAYGCLSSCKECIRPGILQEAKVLGKGAFASVHLIVEDVTEAGVAGKMYALKVASTSEREATSRFEYEALITSEINHPCIVST